jgi:hypothetical protein
MLRKFLIKVVVFALVFSFPVNLFLYAKPHTPKVILLTPAYNIQNNPYFDWVIRERADQKKLEDAKVEYLIERVRKSPYTFVRNGSEHMSNQAAEHLTHKYRKAKERINTARQFIEHLATRSSSSGKLYMMKLPKEIAYPTGEILENELEILETELQNLR